MAAALLLTVNLATLACASLLYGMFVVLFASSTYLLVGRYIASQKLASAPRNSVFRSTVFIATVCLFCAVTAHWITTVYRAFLAFIYFRNGDAALQFYVDMAQGTELVQEALLMLSIMIGDALIIHRLWVVWERRLAIVLLPSCTLVALTLCSAVSLFTVSRKDTAADFFSDPWITSNCFLTLLYLPCPVFITYRIWKITRVVSPIGGSKLREFLVIVVESAALYASWAILFTATYRARSLVQFVVIQCAPAVVGIANAMIHTRVGLGWAIEAQTDPGAAEAPTSQLAFEFAKGMGRMPRVTVQNGLEDTVRRPSGDSDLEAGLQRARRTVRDVENDSEKFQVGRGYETEEMAGRHCAGCLCGRRRDSAPARQDATDACVRGSTHEQGTTQGSIAGSKNSMPGTEQKEDV
ncbi:hypothetical protein GGX14DRAFT_483129 [Mycena pura]|uniref:Uncharacterized protein n=1 Tax=Mycena pura TaxID=153505 RepID=A0AAD6XY86_9AGAR|nr:hypothetical protein GGX14DRAFT_483129 [Mycena pura]